MVLRVRRVRMENKVILAKMENKVQQVTQAIRENKEKGVFRVNKV